MSQFMRSILWDVSVWGAVWVNAMFDMLITNACM